jgi:hypothetical protein
MAAEQHGTVVTQEELRASRYFTEAWVVDDNVIRRGGLHTEDLWKAMEELAPIEGRKWVGGDLGHPMTTPDEVRATLGGFLGRYKSSMILRVEGESTGSSSTRSCPTANSSSAIRGRHAAAGHRQGYGRLCTDRARDHLDPERVSL